MSLFSLFHVWSVSIPPFVTLWSLCSLEHSSTCGLRFSQAHNILLLSLRTGPLLTSYTVFFEVSVTIQNTVALCESHGKGLLTVHSERQLCDYYEP